MQICHDDDTETVNVRGGNISIRTRESDGTWGAPVQIAQHEYPRGLDRPSPCPNGHADMRWIFCEAAIAQEIDGIQISADSKAGYQRLYAYGDRGFVKANNPRFISLSTESVSEGRLIGDKVAVISSDNMRRVFTITSDPDNKFAIVDNYLTLSNTLNLATKSTHSVTISGTLRGQTISQTFTITVLAADSLLDKMLLEYNLNEGSGQTIIDSSRYGMDGGLSDSPTVSEDRDPTWESTGLLFGSTLSKRTETEFSEIYNKSTFHMFFVAKNTAASSASIINRREFGAEAMWSIISNSLSVSFIAFNISGGTLANIAGAGGLSTSVWNLIEVIVDGLDVTIRSGGVDIGTGTLPSAIPLKEARFHIGEYYTSTTSYNGRVGYVAKYDTKLTGADLTAAKARAAAAMSAKGVTISYV